MNNSAICVQLTLISVNGSSDPRTFFIWRTILQGHFFGRTFHLKDILKRTKCQRHFVPKTKSPGYFVEGHFEKDVLDVYLRATPLDKKHLEGSTGEKRLRDVKFILPLVSNPFRKCCTPLQKFLATGLFQCKVRKSTIDFL